jgi:hypothetical protein
MDKNQHLGVTAKRKNGSDLVSLYGVNEIQNNCLMLFMR